MMSSFKTLSQICVSDKYRLTIGPSFRHGCSLSCQLRNVWFLTMLRCFFRPMKKSTSATSKSWKNSGPLLQELNEASYIGILAQEGAKVDSENCNGLEHVVHLSVGCRVNNPLCTYSN